MVDKKKALILMENVIKELENEKLGLIYKGAFVLRLLAEKKKVTTPSRLTRDIDANIVKKDVTYEYFIDLIEKIVSKLGHDYLSIEIADNVPYPNMFFIEAVDYRNKSEGERVFGIDFNNTPNPWCCEYQLDNGVVILGQTMEKIFVDKMLSVSTVKVERRPWDIFDMYVLSFMEGLFIKNIVPILKAQDKELEDFKQLSYPTDRLKSVWKRRRGIVDRPDFKEMLGRVRDLCTPFMVKEPNLAGKWHVDDGNWQEQTYLNPETGEDKLLSKSTVFVE